MIAKKIALIVIGLFILVGLAYMSLTYHPRPQELRSLEVFGTDTDIQKSQQSLAFEPFSSSFTIEEAGSMQESSSGIFWVSSGGRLSVQDTVARTITGDLPVTDRWFTAYKNANPTDTDGGLHPQNIFRLIAKNVWGDARQELYYKFEKFNLSASPNRNATNGMFIFQRYKDQYNLYYSGIRVDGYVVIKKKIAGTYYTMGSARVFDGTYNRDTNPTLLPVNQWMGFRTETINTATGGVTLNVYTDPDASGVWKLALTVTDDGIKYGGPAFTTAGYSGLRTDFADVAMRSYIITDLAATADPVFPVTPPVVTPEEYTDPTVVAAPVVTITKPIVDGSYSRRKTIPIAVTSDQSATITVLVDTKNIKTCTLVTSCSVSWNAKSLPIGAHVITATATNAQKDTTTTTLSLQLTK